MEHRRGIVNACGAASAAGLSLILLWCTLMGHTPGFLLSSLGLAEWVNARTFWLTGILVVAAVLTAAGKWQISDIHITDLLDIRTESHYNAT